MSILPLARVAAEHKPQPTVAISDSCTTQSMPESGSRPDFDGAKQRSGCKTHIAVHTLAPAGAAGSRAPTSRTERRSES